jgi:hypothetical protein
MHKSYIGRELRKDAVMKDVYYIYEHIRPDTGDVFYVGKGVAGRGYNFKRRHKAWQAVRDLLLSKGLDVVVRIHADRLPNESAHCLERMRIATFKALGVELVNQNDGTLAPVGAKEAYEQAGDEVSLRRLRALKSMQCMIPQRKLCVRRVA